MHPLQGKYHEVDGGGFDFVKVIATSETASGYAQFRQKCPNSLVTVDAISVYQEFPPTPHSHFSKLQKKQNTPRLLGGQKLE